MSFSGRELLWARSKPYFLLDQKVEKNQAWHLKKYQLSIQFFKEQNHVDAGKLFFVIVSPTQKFHGAGAIFLSDGGGDDLKD